MNRILLAIVIAALSILLVKFWVRIPMRLRLLIAVVALYILHQDLWFWRTAHPMVFGFIPVGLFYQACFSVAASLVMWLLVKYAWPAQLEREIEERDPEEDSAH